MAAADILRSTTFRLALAATVVVACAAATAMALIGRHVSARQIEATERAIERDAADLRRTFAEKGFPALAEAVEWRSRHAGAPGALYYLSDTAGMRRAGNLATLPAGLSGGDRGTFAWRPVTGGGERAGAGLLATLDGSGVLVVARDIEEQRRFLGLVQLDLALALAGLALVGLGLGLVSARSILGRIDAMARASRVIMDGNLAGRLPRTGSGDELDRLADQLNAMLERIERLLAGLREVSDNIAHDLKTPLNRLRNRAEAALADRRQAPAWREGLEATIESADDLIKTFNALLLIARLEAGAIEETLADVDLAEVARDVAELYEPAAEEAGLALDVVATGPAPIRANRQLVGQAIANLVDNAIKYSATLHGTKAEARADEGNGGSAQASAAPREPAAAARITVAVTTTPGHARLVVADRGPGIAPADRERALRRFVRLDASRTKPGTGLGLSLVAAVVQMHRGSIVLEDNAPGLRTVITLPLRVPAVAAPPEPARLQRRVEA